MKFPKNLMAVFTSLGLVKKARGKELTAKDWEAVNAAYKKKFGRELSADQRAYEKSMRQQEQTKKVAADNETASIILNEALDKNKPKTGGAKAKPRSVTEAATEIVEKMTGMIQTILPDNSKEVNHGGLSVMGPGHTPKHLFGISHNMFSMDHRWNKIAVNPGIVHADPANEDKHGEAFRKYLKTYSQKVGRRLNFHRQNNTLNPKVLTASTGLDVNLSGNGGLGDQYVVIRIDQLIARLLSIHNVYHIFPRRFGVQDRELMTNAFFGDFSQAYQEGEVWKGTIDLKPEMCYVDDSMMKTLFKSMKWLEREYIGYLNQENSDPIKWSMIEWALLSISTKLILEQNERKLLGLYIKPEKGEPGHYLNAGTGVYYTLLRYYNEGKMSLLDNPAYGSYTSGSTMVEMINEVSQELAKKVDNFESDYEIILNANHRAMWKAGIREIYGKDMDFTGPHGDVIPDTTIPIRWCPYLKQLPLFIFQKPGNIQSIELEPGEMHSLSFESVMENVRAWSVWKEGTAAAYVGKPFDSKEDCRKNDFTEQQVFMNKPCMTIAVDATEVTVDGDFRHYVTGANTTAAEITDIVGAKQGVAYMIEANGDFPQSIKKAGKFANITAAYSPSKKGDYILVAATDKDCNKFLELERCEGGVRKINSAAQPNVPGPGGRL